LEFILDGMLGKLARWLRMMGHDTKYSTAFTDAQLLTVAKTEKRTLLTRDLALYQQAIAKNIDAYYVEGTTEPQHLSELSQRYKIALDIDLAQSRCPKCNGKLTTVPKVEVTEKVEKNTLRYYSEFWCCPDCGSVYWQGAHWTKIRQTLKLAEEQKEKKTRLP
jgi:uncharacterized protein with PIN domain